LNEEVHSLNQSFLSDELGHPEAFSRIITCSRKMKQIFKYIEAIAESPKPVLITGESGTGKELVAEVIHTLSKRSGEFVPINIGGFDDTMLSDSLFGHLKGAFTGAVETRKGFIEQAKKGTLFLDEIGDLAMSSQVKLLRLVQEKEYFTLGSDSVRETDARMIFATNADLLAKKANQEFRKDLYYRLVTHHVELPPLRERPEDIPLLIGHFAEKAAGALGKSKLPVPEKIYSLLTNYPFPGNIRELESMLYNAVSASDAGELSAEYICDHISKHLTQTEEHNRVPAPGNPENRVMSLVTSLGKLPKVKDVEDFLIDEALRQTNGNMALAARMIGISPATMTRRMREKKL
jgi:DNA-binding NtrC family response regulator